MKYDPFFRRAAAGRSPAGAAPNALIAFSEFALIIALASVSKSLVPS
jgi:hypothetical protein